MLLRAPSCVNFSIASSMALGHALGLRCVLWKAGMVLLVVLNFIGLANRESRAGRVIVYGLGNSQKRFGLDLDGLYFGW